MGTQKIATETQQSDSTPSCGPLISVKKWHDKEAQKQDSRGGKILQWMTAGDLHHQLYTNVLRLLLPPQRDGESPTLLSGESKWGQIS